MSEINYQALREAAEAAKGDTTWQNLQAFHAAATPEVVQALLDEREAQSKRIAELETNLAALAVENVGIKSAIPEPRDIEDDNDNMDDVSLAEDFGFNHAIERMRRRIETPATDAFLAEVRAQGVEMAMEHMQSSGSLTFGDCYISLNEFAAQLRKGGNQ
ncbi:ead/Ea22-like family protein [Escherichia coli]|nr:ead/Ea22-like family protein [Escherichia coli]